MCIYPILPYQQVPEVYQVCLPYFLEIQAKYCKCNVPTGTYQGHRTVRNQTCVWAGVSRTFEGALPLGSFPQPGQQIPITAHCRYDRDAAAKSHIKLSRIDNFPFVFIFLKQLFIIIVINELLFFRAKCHLHLFD